jgi:hypothetical protein
MEDSHVYAMLVSLHEQIREHQKTSDEGVLVAHALRLAMMDLHPDFDRTYAKHYQDVKAGPLGKNSAEKLEQLDALIEELGKLIQKKSQA